MANWVQIIEQRGLATMAAACVVESTLRPVDNRACTSV